MVRFDETVAYLTFHGRDSCINHGRCPFVDYCKGSFCTNIKTTLAIVDKETSLMVRFDDTVAYLTFHGRDSCTNHERCPFVDYCKGTFCTNIKTTLAIVDKETSLMVRFDDSIAYLTFHGGVSCINHERCPFVDYCNGSFCKNIKTTLAIVDKQTSVMVRFDETLAYLTFHLGDSCINHERCPFVDYCKGTFCKKYKNYPCNGRQRDISHDTF
jgi:phosphoribulokinase